MIALLGSIAAGTSQFLVDIDNCIGIVDAFQTSVALGLWIILSTIASILFIAGGALGAYAHFFNAPKKGIIGSILLEVSALILFIGSIFYGSYLDLGFGPWVLYFLSISWAASMAWSPSRRSSASSKRGFASRGRQRILHRDRRNNLFRPGFPLRFPDRFLSLSYRCSLT